MRVTAEAIYGATVTVPETADPGAVLGTAIERDFANLRRGVELLVWRFLARQGRQLNHQMLRTAADDVLQEAIARVLKRAEAYDPKRSVHAWVFGFAIKVLQERQRREQRDRQHLVADSGAVSDEPERVPGTLLERVSDLVMTDEQGLMELLDLVNAADRKVLTLRYVYKLRGPELAEELGISHGAARTRVSRALSHLTRAYHRADRFAREER